MTQRYVQYQPKMPTTELSYSSINPCICLSSKPVLNSTYLVVGDAGSRTLLADPLPSLADYQYVLWYILLALQPVQCQHCQQQVQVPVQHCHQLVEGLVAELVVLLERVRTCLVPAAVRLLQLSDIG